MKKIIGVLVITLCFVSTAQAEAIVVIDGEGRVIRQMFTAPTEVSMPAATTVTTTTTTTTIPATTSVVTPQMTVVRESPVINNSYYYDRDTTNAAIAAGVTTAVVGGLIYHGFRPHHHPRGHWGRPPHRHWR